MGEETMRLASKLLAALLVLLAPQVALAQSAYPNRPAKILVGFTPGTAPDLAARTRKSRGRHCSARGVRGREEHASG